MTGLRAACAAALAALCAGCGLFEEAEPILPGERTPVRAAAQTATLPPERAALIGGLGPETALAEWPQLNGAAGRAPGRLAGPSAAAIVWSTDIGQGASGDGAITSTPVVAQGRVFTLDAASGVAAVNASTGASLWRASLAPPGEAGADGFGGGLAVDDGRVFAATGFGEVVALSAQDGTELWRQRLGAPIRAAPAVEAGRVFVVTRDSAGFALDAATGAIRWRVVGARGGAGALGGAAPAAAGGLVVFPFLSGELAGVAAASGRRVWSDALTGGRRGLASADISDITGDPVMDGTAVFAASHSGQLVALDARTGRRGWLRAIGADTPVWTVGQTIFVLDNEARLHRLAAATGETMWATDLRRFEDEEDREDAIAYGGPVVVGDGVFITSSREGLMRFDAATGAALGATAIPGGASVGPVVAGGAVYVLSDAGVLHALR